MTPLLQVANLTKTFFMGRQRLQAVDGLTFSIEAGEVLGLAGESGCGKSTVGKLILRLMEPNAGSIWFEGQNILEFASQDLKKLRCKMQMVFQNPAGSLNPKMTIEEILSEPFQIHSPMRKNEYKMRVEELLTLVGLQPTYLKRLPHELSGGQKQRIGIARALALQPRFLVCDEPLSALDISIQAQVVNLLKQLQQELGLTYLFISHDLSVMRYLANRVAVMYFGQLVELAPTHLLYTTPLHPYTQALLSAIPIPDPELERTRSRIFLKGDIPSPLKPPPGCRFCPRCPFAKKICQEVAPQWKEVKPGHFTACHLHS